MKARSRLKHAAAGLLGSLISRNNDVSGYWAPGLLYHDASAPPHVMEIDILTNSSKPSSEAAKIVAGRYSLFLRSALAKQGFVWNDVTQATINFQFNANVPDPNFYYPCGGAPFICSVTLATNRGHCVSASKIARCYARRSGLFLTVRGLLSRSRSP